MSRLEKCWEWFCRRCSRLGCRIGVHDWRDGPGWPCVKCGKPDDIDYGDISE